MSWNPGKRRSPAQRAHAKENLRRIHARQQDQDIENIPPSSPPDGNAAPLEPLTPLRYLHSANERLAAERRQNEVRGRELRNALLREGRLRNANNSLKAKLGDIRAERKAGEVVARARVMAAQTEARQADARAQEADVEKAEAKAEAAAATARAASADGRVRAAEAGQHYAEAWAQAAAAQVAQAKQEAGAACAHANAAEVAFKVAMDDKQAAEAQAQAADVQTQLVAAQYSEAFRGLAVNVNKKSQAAIAMVQEKANDALTRAEEHISHVIEDARGRVEAAEARSHAAECVTNDAWVRAAAAVKTMRTQFSQHVAQLEARAQSTVSSIVLLAGLVISDKEAYIKVALDQERQEFTSKLADAREEANEAMQEEHRRAQAAVAHADAVAADVEMRMSAAMDEAEGYLGMARQMLESHASHVDELTDLHKQLEDSLSTSSLLRARINNLSKQNKALKLQVTRAQERKGTTEQISATLPSALVLKEKGVIPDATRNLIRDLISFGLKVNQVRKVIEAVAHTSGTVVKGDVSDRSVRRITLEGLVASELQVAIESKSAEGITISSDGTTHKNINYEARHLHFNTGDTHTRRTLGIQSAPNHTSSAQLTGWKAQIQSVLDTYNASPLAGNGPLDTQTFLQKVYGMLTDHAEDQKCLKRLFAEWKQQVDREVRGERAIADLAPLDLLPILAEEVSSAVADAGGAEAWSALTADKLNEANLAIRRSVITRLGEDAYAALPESEKQLADLFVHAGCCMHKELNSVKGGTSRMVKSWSKSGLQPPVLLMNRDNSVAATSGATVAAKRATEKSVGGAIKLADLAGALFRHKDDKKGQQDATRYHFEAALGMRFTFPDTSNTRYQSYCEAAGELLVHLQLYRDFLEIVRDKKTTGLFNHMEQNVYKGLHDIPTLTELCVLALYGQSVCHPYMREVRGPQEGLTNHLELGPLHDRLKAHMAHIIADPDVLLAPDATYTTASLDGKPWERPTVVISVLELAPTLPHLRTALVEFFSGALETWERFTAEFAPGGIIARLSAKHRQLAWMPTTNDENEGALGSMRNALRAAPSMSLHQHNARVMYKLNDTSEFVTSSCGPAEQKFFRGRAREIDASGIEHKRRMDVAIENERSAKRQKGERQAKESRKIARRAKLARIEPILDLSLLTMARTVHEIQEQLAWHREFIDLGPKAEKKMPMAKMLTSKALKLAALVDAVRRYNAAPPVDQPWLDVDILAAETVLDEEDDDDDDE